MMRMPQQPRMTEPGPWGFLIEMEVEELPPIETLYLSEHVSSVIDNTDGTIITEIRE